MSQSTVSRRTRAQKKYGRNWRTELDAQAQERKQPATRLVSIRVGRDRHDICYRLPECAVCGAGRRCAVRVRERVLIRKSDADKRYKDVVRICLSCAKRIGQEAIKGA